MLSKYTLFIVLFDKNFTHLYLDRYTNISKINKTKNPQLGQGLTSSKSLITIIKFENWRDKGKRNWSLECHKACNNLEPCPFFSFSGTGTRSKWLSPHSVCSICSQTATCHYNRVREALFLLIHNHPTWGHTSKDKGHGNKGKNKPKME